MSKIREVIAEKIRLEQDFSKELKSLFSRHTREFFNLQIGRQRTDFNFRNELTEKLFAHYQIVKKSFLGGISLPQRLRMTDEENDTLNRFLDNRFKERAETQSLIIKETTDREEQEAITLSNIDAEQQRQEGIQIGATEIAVVAAALLSRKLRSRTDSISSFETQASAEDTRKAEVGMLLGNTVDPISSSRRSTSVVKEWVTVGDERVRPAHRAADGQIVPENEPFIVGGEKLMKPGDMSLGASLENVINCRCSAIYNQDSILAERERLLDVTIIVEGPFVNQQ